MRCGSMFAGIGGLDLAVEWALGATPAWQLDLTGHEVRSRHWPGVEQVVGDVRQVNPATLPRVDVLCGGFPCQDLSVAGTGAGLEGKRSGLYVEVVRFVRALRPGLVVLENVPGLLKYRERLESDLGALGYGLTWVRARALDAGHPHKRARVFVVAELGATGRGVLDADRSGEWSGDAIRPDRVVAERPWATVLASEDKGRRTSIARRGNPDLLSEQVRPWATPSATDYKGGADGQRRGQLGEQLPGKRLHPEWVEALMGLPQGWTSTDGPRLEADPAAPAVRGRYPEGWDRSQPWPGYDWEPSRTLPDGPPAKGRPARLRAIGNAVCPQQGALALETWAQPTQRTLWSTACHY